jgi:hypothetical protein
MNLQSIIPNRIHFIVIGLLSLSMISLQILMTRIFSVIFYYHFAFAGITFAMLGLTIGAFKVYDAKLKFSLSDINEWCSKHMLRAGVLLSITSLAIVDFSGRLLSLYKDYEGTTGDIIQLAAIAVIFLGPFVFVKIFADLGVCITLLLTCFPSYTNRLYAVDLISAAFGCVAVVAALYFLDPISIILLMSSVMAILAWKLIKANPLYPKKLIAGAAIALCTIFVVQSASYTMGSPLFGLRIGKLRPLEEFKFERWNSFTHVGISPKHDRFVPFGWGFGSKLNMDDYPNIEQYWLKIDASAGTILTRFDGDYNKVSYLKYDVTNFPYHLRDINHVAVIGVGGGRDVLSALLFGVKQITGIEINPAIFEALNKVFADFTGRISSNPNVNLINAEARSYISSQKTAYDMIQISLIDTWAATAAGGLALSENKLYTKEAWDEFLNHLNEDGVLSISRWFIPGKHHGELYRMLSLTTDSLKKLDPNINVRDHVIVVSANDVITLLVSKSPFSAEEIKKIAEICETYGFKEVITPHKNFDNTSDTIIAGNATADFYNSLPLDVVSPTDDRPFFFNMIRFTDALLRPFININNNMDNDYNGGNNEVVYLLFSIFAILLVYMAYAIIFPMYRLYRANRQQFSDSKPFIVYFALIGLGFMLIEMSIMQWLMIFLGHPVYALSVVLFTMLLFSGIGSYTVSYDKLRSQTYVIRSLFLCLFLCATFWIISDFRDIFTHNNTSMRIMLSVLLLIPVSLFLGMMFPLGVAAAKRRHAELLPWFWALNGVFSVFASILSVVISMGYGASITYIFGIACYIICTIICFRIRREI